MYPAGVTGLREPTNQTNVASNSTPASNVARPDLAFITHLPCLHSAESRRLTILDGGSREDIPCPGFRLTRLAVGLGRPVSVMPQAPLAPIAFAKFGSPVDPARRRIIKQTKNYNLYSRRGGIRKSARAKSRQIKDLRLCNEALRRGDRVDF